MADQTVVHIGENSPEYVALRLMEYVAAVENKGLYNGGGADRQWILNAYAQCLKAVRSA